MADYQLTATDTVIRTADGACIPSDPANRDRAEYGKWLAAGGVPDPVDVPPSPLVVSQPPVLVAAALNINVVDGDITGIDGLFNIIGGAYLGVGVYWLFFTDEEPDATYYAIITGDAPAKTMTEQHTDFFVIETLDGIGGAHIDPPQTSVQIFRIVT